MWNKSIKFPTTRATSTDNQGFVTTTPTYMTGIPASFKSTTRNDEILANTIGYTADVIVEVMHMNYNGQDYLIDESDNQVYDIKRSFWNEKKCRMQLTCQRRE